MKYFNYFQFHTRDNSWVGSDRILWSRDCHQVVWRFYMWGSGKWLKWQFIYRKKIQTNKLINNFKTLNHLDLIIFNTRYLNSIQVGYTLRPIWQHMAKSPAVAVPFVRVFLILLIGTAIKIKHLNSLVIRYFHSDYQPKTKTIYRFVHRPKTPIKQSRDYKICNKINCRYNSIVIDAKKKRRHLQCWKTKVRNSQVWTTKRGVRQFSF